MKMIYAGGACNNSCFIRYGGCGVHRKHNNGNHLLSRSPAKINAAVTSELILHNPAFIYTPDMFSGLYYKTLFTNLEERSFGYIGINASVVTLKQRLAEGLKMSDIVKKGIKEIWLGIESGSLAVRKDFNKPHFTNEDVIEITHLGTEYGINMCWYLIDTPDNPTAEKETYKLIVKGKPYRVRISQLINQTTND